MNDSKNNVTGRFLADMQDGTMICVDKYFIEDGYGLGDIAKERRLQDGLLDLVETDHHAFGFICDFLLASEQGQRALGNGFCTLSEDDIADIFISQIPDIRIIDTLTDESILIRPYIIKIIQDTFTWEVGEQYHGFLWTQQLQNFIDQGQWFLKRKPDGKTELFFGLDEESQLPEWTLGKDGLPALAYERDDDFGVYSLDGLWVDGMFLNYQLLFPDPLFWYFVEGANIGANPTRVIKTAPINLGIFEEL